MVDKLEVERDKLKTAYLALLKISQDDDGSLGRYAAKIARAVQPDATTPRTSVVGEQAERVTPLMVAYASVEIGRLARQEPDMRLDGLTDAEIRRILEACVPTPTEDARERVKVLEEAITAALSCTPTFGVERGNMGQPVSYIQYDCGDPWDILRAALGNKETDRHG
jgi:hypothetical protein